MKKFFTFTLAALATVATFAGTLTCDEAVTIAQDLEPNTPTEDEYTVEGYVISIISNSSSKLSFWMADDANAEQGTFEAWQCTGDVVNKGDKVEVTGNLQWYVNPNKSEDQKAEIYQGTVKVVTPAPVDKNYAEFIASDFEGMGTERTGSEVSVPKNGVTVYTDGGYGASYSLRVYKNKQFKISADRRIVKIAFTFDNYNGDYTGGLDPEVCVEGTEWEVASMAAQARISKIAVTLGDDECSITPIEYPVIFVTEAIALAKELKPEPGRTLSTDQKYEVRGYVASISQKKENTFYMGANMEDYAEFQVYKYDSADGVVEEGAYVSATGYISNYCAEDGSYNSYEIKGGPVVVIWGAALENTKAKQMKAVKMFDGNQVIFKANGVKYNVLGNIVK